MCLLWASWALPYLSLLPWWSFSSRYCSPEYQWVKTRHCQRLGGERWGQLTALLSLFPSLSVSLYHTTPSLFLYITRFKAQTVPCGKCLITDSFLSTLSFRLYNPNPRKASLFILKWPWPVGKALPAALPQLGCTHSSQWPGLAWRLLRQLRWQLCTRTCPTALVWSPGSPGTPPHLQTLCLVGQKNTEGGSVRLFRLKKSLWRNNHNMESANRQQSQAVWKLFQKLHQQDTSISFNYGKLKIWKAAYRWCNT